jgi:hypothetical protein
MAEIGQVTRKIDRAVLDVRDAQVRVGRLRYRQRLFVPVDCHDFATWPGKPSHKPTEVTIAATDIEYPRTGSYADVAEEAGGGSIGRVRRGAQR